MKIRIEIDTTEPCIDIPELVSEVLADAAGGFNEARKDHALTGFLEVAEDGEMTVGPIKVSGEYEYTRPNWQDPFKLAYTMEITV